jgi:DNA polymerase I-like protein with 3'-5' exonuclease and polymerase domains
MDFKLDKAIEILERTQTVIEDLLKGLSREWIMNNEGKDTWSPYDIVGHLIHGEKTDWIVRMEIIMSDNKDKSFQPFDRFAQFEQSKGKTLQQLMDEFKELRKQNIASLNSKKINDSMLNKTGIHPEFGTVTLSQLLSTWVVHDLSHIAQIARVMAKQYKAETGPWVAYLPILNL